MRAVVVVAGCLMVLVAAATGGAQAAVESPGWVWTEAKAEAELEATYRRPDGAWMHEATAELGTATAIGDPVLIESAQRALEAAKRGFSVDFATCVGRGAPTRYRGLTYYAYFRCKLEMTDDQNDLTVFRRVSVTGRSSYRTSSV